MPLKEIDVGKIYEEIPKLKEEDVKNIMEWVKMQPHLPEITELQTILFHHSCHFSNELTKNTIDIHFTVKTLCPELFGNRVPSDPSMQETMDCSLITYLPKLTPDGDRILLVKLLNCNPDLYNLACHVKYFDMLTAAHLHKHGPDNGVLLVLDFKGVVFGHVLKLNVVWMKKFLYYLQEGMPIRAKSFQLFNIVPFTDKVLAIMKPFMKKEFMDSLTLYKDQESLFKKLPQEIFPVEYGGSCESTDILKEKCKTLMNDGVDLFKFQDSQLVDESKRREESKAISDVFGLNGTFKKLEVD